MKIDFVSDIACPWCAVGLRALDEAMNRVGSALEAELHFQPFELNPQMPPQGEDAVEHLIRKYRISAQQVLQNTEVIRARGAELGFTFDMAKRRRVYNTFDSHRLLHWAGEQGEDPQKRLKYALLRACFTEGLDVSDHRTLVSVCEQVGLDGGQAQRILETDDMVEVVRRQERFYVDRGIAAVPSVIFNDRHLVQGAQPVEAFEATLRRLTRLPTTVDVPGS